MLRKIVQLVHDEIPLMAARVERSVTMTVGSKEEFIIHEIALMPRDNIEERDIFQVCGKLIEKFNRAGLDTSLEDRAVLIKHRGKPKYVLTLGADVIVITGATSKEMNFGKLKELIIRAKLKNILKKASA